MHIKASEQAKWKEASKECARQIQRHAFDGNYPLMRVALDSYLSSWSTYDPSGRTPLSEALSALSPLAYRSSSTSLVEHAIQTRDRVKAWMAILPFDLQLSLVRFEWRHDHRLSAFQIQDLAWDVWNGCLSASDPGQALREAGQSNWVPGNQRVGSKKVPDPDWRLYAKGVAQTVRHHAAHLASMGQWSDLDAWMGAGRINAWDRMAVIYIDYRQPNCSGSAMANLKTPLPFWMLGLFNGVTAPEYWEVMSRHGGPSTPLCGSARPPRRRLGSAFTPLLGRVRTPSDWSDPVSWIQQDPDSLWSRDPSMLDVVRQQTQLAQSAWRRQALLADIIPSSPSTTLRSKL